MDILQFIKIENKHKFYHFFLSKGIIHKVFSIGKFGKLHGFKGSIRLYLYYDYSYELLISAELVGLKLEKIFGHVENVCKVKFENVSDATHLINQELIVVPILGKFFPAQLIGLKLIIKSKEFLITQIHNFGAGDLVEAGEKLYILKDLDLGQVEKGIVLLK